MTTNPLPLAAVRAIKEEAEKATQGPWATQTGVAADGSEFVCVNPNVCIEWEPDERDIANFDFIAHARTNVPALCDTVETLVEIMQAARRSLNSADTAARIIDAILSTIDPPSGEAQTAELEKKDG
jgi:hypothetical protein